MRVMASIVQVEDAIVLAKAGDVAGLAVLPDTSLMAPDRWGSTALHWAAGCGHLAAVRYLLEERGLPPDLLEIQPSGTGRQRGISHRTPLHFAARNGHLAVVQHLNRLGSSVVNPDHRATDGVTPFQHACWQNRLEVAQYLVAHCGVDPAQVNLFGCGAQHWVGLAPRERAGADGEGLLPLCQWLRVAGLDWAAAQIQGHTPLHKAAYGGQIEVCRWLRKELGVLDDRCDHAGNFAADIAEMGRQPATAAWLRTHSSAVRAKAASLLGVPYEVRHDDPALRIAYLVQARFTHPDRRQHERVGAKNEADHASSGGGGGSNRSAGDRPPDFEAVVAAFDLLRDPVAAAEGAAAQRNPTHSAPLLLGSRQLSAGEGFSGTVAAVAKKTLHVGAGVGEGAEEGRRLGPRSQEFKTRLALTVNEFLADSSSSSMPLGLLPKKYEQLWGVLPASATLGLKPKLGLLQLLRHFQDVVAIHQRKAGRVTIRPRQSTSPPPLPGLNATEAQLEPLNEPATEALTAFASAPARHADTMNAEAIRVAQRVAQRAASTGSRKLAKWASELSTLELTKKISLLENRLLQLHPADFCAAYLMLCFSHIFPQSFIGGKRTSNSVTPQQEQAARPAAAFPPTLVALPGTGSRGEPCSYQPARVLGSTLLCSDIEGLRLSARDASKIGGLEVPVLHIFERFELKSTPAYVNTCLVSWAAGKRPLVLMTRVASVKELMTMQSEGRRCVTCFTGLELGTEWPDPYPPHAVKDSVHFLIHDLQHCETCFCCCRSCCRCCCHLDHDQFGVAGEKLCDPELYCEQVKIQCWPPRCAALIATALARSAFFPKCDTSWNGFMRVARGWLQLVWHRPSS